MRTKGGEYSDQRQGYFEERYRQRVMHHLSKRAKELGFRLAPIPGLLETRQYFRGVCFLRAVTAPHWFELP